MLSFVTAAVLLSTAAAAAAVNQAPGPPSVQLAYSNVIGSSFVGVDSFQGIPYAQPPVGPLRLKPPRNITGNLGTVYAISVPQACPQFLTSTYGTGLELLPMPILQEVFQTGLFQAVANVDEDCLTVNVQRPSTATAGSKLPVLFWMYGGGFSFGSTSIYDATKIIQNSVLEGKPIIYVSVNYRLGGFGWMPGKEILEDGSANLGHLDQRLALQWVADNIAKFGGDPDKVTIWGESAGSISVFNQMALYGGDHTYKGKPLFRGAIMDSGSLLPAESVDGVKGQQTYDMVVRKAGCSRSPDTLACLRMLPYEVFLAATTSVPFIAGYNSVDLSYLPRPDGKVLPASGEVILQSGKIAPVPFIVGDQEDEGTLFSLFQSNITTTADLNSYFNTLYYLKATETQIEEFVGNYPDDPTAGSPFRTGYYNQVYPQFKRLAAILGDVIFTLMRRGALHYTSIVHPTVPSWSYLASYGYGTPLLGTFHATDIDRTYGIQPGVSTYTILNFCLNFVYNLDPNNVTQGLPAWPQWSEGNMLMNFLVNGSQLITDDFRNQSYQFILANAGVLHL